MVLNTCVVFVCTILVHYKNFVRCTLWNLKIYIKCNKTDKKTYDKLKQEVCLKCNEKNLFLFSTESNNSESYNKHSWHQIESNCILRYKLV